MKRNATIVGACRCWHRFAVRSHRARFRGCRRCAPQPPANRSQRSALPGTWTVRERNVALLVQSHPLLAHSHPLLVQSPPLLAHWHLSLFRQAGGLPAISRGSSAATSPVNESKTSRTAKAVPADGRAYAGATIDIRRSAGTALRCGRDASGSGGVVAVLLNPRLMAGNPSGLLRPRALRKWQAASSLRLSLPSSPQAGGLPAISRGSSAATSPVNGSKTSRTAKAVPADGNFFVSNCPSFRRNSDR